MRSIRCAALCLLAAAMPALAEFEGVLEMKMRMKSGTSGTARTYVSKTGWRTEMDFQNPQLQKATGKASMKVTMLGKMRDPDRMYNVDDEQKTYFVIDANRERERAGKRDEETFTVKKLGPDSVAGFACENVLVRSSNGNEFEACAAIDSLGTSAWLSAMQQRGRGGAYAGWAHALKEAGVGQFLVRMVMHDKTTKEESMRMELVRTERKSVPSSLFEIPPGYREEDPMNPGMGGMNLTPEQRKAMEDVMRARQKGNN